VRKVMVTVLAALSAYSPSFLGACYDEFVVIL
jgi:hypothetical protein